MHIAVCIKQVPNTTQVRINPETNTLIRDGVESVINPFDENALELALVLKEQNPGTTVTAICMGPMQAGDALKECVARGADAAILLCDRAVAGSDTWATSYALARTIQKMPEAPALILFGKQAIDGDTAQVGPGVAEWLGMPCITYVRAAAIEDGKLLIERAFEDGWEKLSAAMPCALTVLKEANIPRMASLRGKMAAKKLVLEPTTAEAIEAAPDHIGLNASPTRVVRIFSPPPKTGGQVWKDEEPAAVAEKLVATLRESKLI